jgi:hypothetical protein
VTCSFISGMIVNVTEYIGKVYRSLLLGSDLFHVINTRFIAPCDGFMHNFEEKKLSK